MHPRLFQMLFPGYSEAALQYINRTTAMSRARMDIESQFIDGLSAGIWNITDCLYLLDTVTNADSLLNVKSSSFSLTANGSPTWTANQGYTFSGTQDLNTGFNPSSAGGNFTQDSAGILTWTPTAFGAGSDSGASVGYKGASDNIYIQPHFTDNIFYISLNSTIGVNTANVAANLYGINRTNNLNVALFQDTAKTAIANASNALVNDNLVIGNRINDGTPFLGTLSIVLIGATYSDEQTRTFYQLCRIRRAQVAGGA